MVVKVVILDLSHILLALPLFDYNVSQSFPQFLTPPLCKDGNVVYEGLLWVISLAQ